MELLWSNQIGLVEHQRRAELNLLNEQVLDVILFNIWVEKIGAVVELLKHASTVNNCDDVIKVEVRVISCMLALIAECRNVIGNGDWLADARSLNNDVVKLLGIGQITQLKCQVIRKGAAEATVSKRNNVAFFSVAAVFNKTSINVNLANVVDNDCCVNTFSVRENVVQNSGLTCA